MGNDYLERIMSGIENDSAKESICLELEDHIQSKIEYYEELGYTIEQAEEKAIEDMGEPEEAAAPLDMLHKNTRGRIKSTIFILVIFFLPFVFAVYLSNIDLDIHSLEADLVSLGFFAVCILLLYLARKNHSRSVLFIFISVTMGYSSFKPMVYGVYKIMFDGFDGYVSSILGRGYLCENPTVDMLSTVTGIVITVVLVVWIALDYILIKSEIQLKNTLKLRHILKRSEKVAACAIAINLAVILMGTATAFANLDSISAESNSVRCDMIDYILDADMSLNSTRQLKSLSQSGFEMIDITDDEDKENEAEVFTCFKGDNILKLSRYNGGGYEIFYEATHLYRSQCGSPEQKEFLSQIYEGENPDPNTLKSIFHLSNDLVRSNYEPEQIEAWLVFEDKISAVAVQSGVVTRNTESRWNLGEENDLWRKTRNFILNNNVTKQYFTSKTQVDDLLSELENKEFKPKYTSEKNGKKLYTYSTDTFVFTLETDEKNNDYAMTLKNKNPWAQAYSKRMNVVGGYEKFENRTTDDIFHYNFADNACLIESRFEYENGFCIPKLKLEYSDYIDGVYEKLKITTIEYSNGEFDKRTERTFEK